MRRMDVPDPHMHMLLKEFLDYFSNIMKLQRICRKGVNAYYSIVFMNARWRTYHRPSHCSSVLHLMLVETRWCKWPWISSLNVIKEDCSKLYKDCGRGRGSDGITEGDEGFCWPNRSAVDIRSSPVSMDASFNVTSMDALLSEAPPACKLFAN
jgi:hypothetical protein